VKPKAQTFDALPVIGNQIADTWPRDIDHNRLHESTYIHGVLGGL
jgi:hypothetical protein